MRSVRLLLVAIAGLIPQIASAQVFVEDDLPERRQRREAHSPRLENALLQAQAIQKSNPDLALDILQSIFDSTEDSYYDTPQGCSLKDAADLLLLAVRPFIFRTSPTLRTPGITPTFVSDSVAAELRVTDSTIGRKKNLLPDVRGVPVVEVKPDSPGGLKRLCGICQSTRGQTKAADGAPGGLVRPELRWSVAAVGRPTSMPQVISAISSLRNADTVY